MTAVVDEVLGARSVLVHDADLRHGRLLVLTDKRVEADEYDAVHIDGRVTVFRYGDLASYDLGPAERYQPYEEAKVLVADLIRFLA